MQSQENVSKTYLIEYLCDMIKQISPDVLENAEQLIIFTSISGNNSTRFIEKFHQCQNLSKVTCKKEGVPNFYRVNKKIVMADFTKYLIKETSKKVTSRQSILNIFYAFQFVKKIKIIINIHPDWLNDPELFKIIDSLKGLQATFRGKIQNIGQLQFDKATKHSLCNSIGFLIADKGHKIQKNKYPAALNSLKQSQQLETQQSVGKEAIDNILTNNHIIFQSDPVEKNLESLKKIGSFNLDRQTFVNYYQSNIQNTSQRSIPQEQRRTFILGNVEKFLDLVFSILSQFKDRIPQIMSLDEEERKNALNQVQSLLPSIDFKKLKSDQKSCSHKQFLIVVISILKDFGKICLQDDLENSEPNLCMPQLIIHTAFKWQQICRQTVLQKSQIYMLGYFLKIGFKLFNFIPDFKQCNKLLSPMPPQFFMTILSQLGYYLPNWLKMAKKNAIRPKLLRQVIKKIEQLIQFLNYLITKSPNQLENDLDQIQNHKKYTQISLVNIKHLYLQKMINHLTENEKIEEIVKLYKNIQECEFELQNINGQATLHLLRLIYQVLGDILVKYEFYYMAIKCYEHGTIFTKLYTTCCKYLSEKLDEIKIHDFQHIIDLLVRLGMIMDARNYCYLYIEKISNESRNYIYQLLYSFSNEEISSGNSECMGFIKDSQVQQIKLLSSQSFNQAIDVIREHQNTSSSLPFLPDLH